MKPKECPFCGNNNDLGVGRGTEDREGYPTYVYCADCGAQGPWIYTRDKAVFTCTAVACEETGWNRRDDTLIEAARWYFECSDFINSGAVKGTGVDEICQSLMWSLRDLRRLVGEK
jgi:hypothetical protein